MTVDLDVVTTLVMAAATLLLGRQVIAAVPALRTYSIPEPVVGGLLAALTVAFAKVLGDVTIGFDTRMQAPLMLAFFATIGLSADVRMIARGGAKVFLFLGVVVVVLVVQNAIGVAAALAFDMHPLAGLIGGSITLSGGHGTGAAYATRFGEVENLQGSMELAMACATFGLVLGGVVGGPVGERLIRIHGLRGPVAAESDLVPGQIDTAARLGVDARSILQALLLVWLSMMLGSYVAGLVAHLPVTVPSFVWVLFSGILLRNVLVLVGRREIDGAGIDVVGTVALALFLAMALMSLRLLDLLALALPILVILAAQTLAVVAYVTFVTFRVMGSNYDAAILAAGQCGFALGATPTAIANMQSLCARHGHSALAFLLVPLVGAFLIDVANTLVIQGFLAVPVVGG